MKKINPKAKIAATVVIHDKVEIEEGVANYDYVVIYPGTVVKAGAEVYAHCDLLLF